MDQESLQLLLTSRQNPAEWQSEPQEPTQRVVQQLSTVLQLLENWESIFATLSNNRYALVCSALIVMSVEEEVESCGILLFVPAV